VRLPPMTGGARAKPWAGRSLSAGVGGSYPPRSTRGVDPSAPPNPGSAATPVLPSARRRAFDRRSAWVEFRIGRGVSAILWIYADLARELALTTATSPLSSAMELGVGRVARSNSAIPRRSFPSTVSASANQANARGPLGGASQRASALECSPTSSENARAECVWPALIFLGCDFLPMQRLLFGAARGRVGEHVGMTRPASWSTMAAATCGEIETRLGSRAIRA